MLDHRLLSSRPHGDIPSLPASGTEPLSHPARHIRRPSSARASPDPQSEGCKGSASDRAKNNRWYIASRYSYFQPDCPEEAGSKSSCGTGRGEFPSSLRLAETEPACNFPTCAAICLWWPALGHAGVTEMAHLSPTAHFRRDPPNGP